MSNDNTRKSLASGRANRMASILESSKANEIVNLILGLFPKLYSCNDKGLKSRSVEVISRCLKAGMSDGIILSRGNLGIDLPPEKFLRGSDAILLGAETFRGLYPIETISIVDKICAV
ncbi:hypothetical protein RJ641_015822, partial [Dillenia turbinata]